MLEKNSGKGLTIPKKCAKLVLDREGKEGKMKIKLKRIEDFRRAVKLLRESHKAVSDCFDDMRFLRDYRIAIDCISEMAKNLGEAELTVRGQV
jgi:hypothetical protein